MSTFTITDLPFPISVQQRGKTFIVTYGKQVKAALTYDEAASELGQCILHALACKGEISADDVPEPTAPKPAKTLVSIQEDAVSSILALPQQGKRAASYGQTLLNRKARGLTAIRQRYHRQSVALGFTVFQANLQWNDVKETAILEANAE